MNPQESNIGRRDFLQMSGGGIVAASAGGSLAQASTANQSTAESSDGIVSQPSPQFAPDLTTADIMVETLISWGATHCFGVVGDGINSFIEALRKRQDRIKYIGVRHEEAAAFMASGFAKHTGQLASASELRALAPSIFSTVSTMRTWTARRLWRLPA
jgi:pyruvate dehydrogenase (quinone)/pyruvate decarboxylase